MMKCAVPVTVIDGKVWLLLNQWDSKIVFRAESIRKDNHRVPDPSGHRLDQAVAEGSVKATPKRLNLERSSLTESL